MLKLIKSKISNDLLFKEFIKELHQNIFDEKKALKLFKSKELNINSVDESGKTLLFDLVKKRKTEAIKFVLKQGININTEDNYGKTVLNEAINLDDGIMIRFLLENGADINYINKSKRSIMQDLALEGNVKAFKMLMIRQASLSHVDLYQRTVLFDAIEGGNLEIVKEVIHELSEDELNNIDDYGRNALFYAVLKEDKTIAKWLISYGIDIHIQDINKQNVLFNTMILGASNIEIVEMLIKKGINLEQEDKVGFTLIDEILKLIYLSKHPVDDASSKYRLVNEFRNYLKLCSVLIEKGLPINLPNKEGKSVLYKEVFKKNYENLEFLIKAGADISVTDKDGRTILFDAIFAGMNGIEMINFLIKKGVDVDHRDKEERTVIDDLVEMILIQQNDKTPIHKRFYDIRQSEDYLELLRRLMALKPKINKPKSNGQTLIFELMGYTNIELLNLFIHNDIDINIIDKKGQTPIGVLIEEGMTLTNKNERDDFLIRLNYLLKFRVNINATDDKGRTLLHKAVIADDLEVVEKLVLSKKIELGIKDSLGRTALHHTQWKGNVKIARLLIANGGDINDPDAAGYTLLNYATILGYIKLIELLISYGVLMYNKNKKSKTVTQFFLKNEANLDKLLENDIPDEKMKKSILEVVSNLKNEIRNV
ncbi:MAG: ankyrin repeat domain-containing protein [Arcobacteraceae bacterium]